MSTQTEVALDHRVPELDGIRAIAIWMVLGAHAAFGFSNDPRALAGVPGPLLQIVGHGWLGVDLFFMLSGFLITGILLDSRRRPRYFRNFYIRRVLRIMPLYFSCVLVWSLVYRNAGRYFLLSSVFGANLSWLLHVPEPHGPGVLWSLAVEEHFYLLWPLIVLLLDTRQLLFFAATIFTITPVARTVFAARGMPPDLIYMLSWFRFDGLAAGAMIAIWAKSPAMTRRYAARLALSLLAALLVVTAVGAPLGLLDTHTPVAAGFRYTQVYLAFGALFALAVAYRNTAWTSPLRWRWVQLSGALSYCLYLVHLSIGDAYEWFMNSRGLSPTGEFGATGSVVVRSTVMIGLSFGIALVSRRYLEQPFLSLKDRFSSRASAAPVVAPAPDATTA